MSTARKNFRLYFDTGNNPGPTCKLETMRDIAHGYVQVKFDPNLSTGAFTASIQGDNGLGWYEVDKFTEADTGADGSVFPIREIAVLPAMRVVVTGALSADKVYVSLLY